MGAEYVRSIRFSSKSGGYTPPDTPGKFYEARRLFSEMLHSPETNVYLQLAPGDMVIFDNERILHARSSIAESDGDRFLQGCYLNRDGIKLGYERLRRKSHVAMRGQEGMSGAADRFLRIRNRFLRMSSIKEPANADVTHQCDGDGSRGRGKTRIPVTPVSLPSSWAS